MWWRGPRKDAAGDMSVDAAVRRLARLMADFPLEWESDFTDDEEPGGFKYPNQLRHKAAGVVVGWAENNSVYAGYRYKVSIWVSGQGVLLEDRHARVLMDAVQVMACRRVELSAPKLEEAGE